MSDIGFHGVAAALIALGMLAVAALGFGVEMLLRWRRPDNAIPRAAAFTGPTMLATAALIIFYIADEGSLDWQSRVDRWSLPIAGVMLVAWIGIRWRATGRRSSTAKT